MNKMGAIQSFNNKRSANFELLRIVCMMMIVMLHLLGNGHGNVLSKTSDFSSAWVMTWGIEALCTIGVNCYVLISGYFLIGNKENEVFNSDGKPLKFKWKKVFRLCCIVWFYNLVFFGVGYHFGLVHLSMRVLFHLVTPITGRTYWFISVYLGLYIISPYLNELLRRLSQSAYKRLIVLCIILFSVVPTVLPTYDTFSAGGGTGIVWFITLYIIAAYIRLYGAGRFEKFRPAKWFVVYIGITGLMLLSKIVISAVTLRFLGESIGTSILYQYFTPICLLSSVLFFMFFRQIRIKGKMADIIVKISPLMFGVYIIHENPFIKDKMWSILSPNIGTNNFILLMKLLVIVILITFTCSMIELVRQKVFALVVYIIGCKK